MFFIDYITPLWIKTLILSLHPIKNMHKHFQYPSYEPKFVVELEETLDDYNGENTHIIINKENKIKNEFDETSEKSQREEKAVARIDLKKTDQAITDNAQLADPDIIDKEKIIQRYINENEKVSYIGEQALYDSNSQCIEVF